MPFAAKTSPIVSNSERGRLFSRMSSSVCVTRSLSTAIAYPSLSAVFSGSIPFLRRTAIMAFACDSVRPR